ncbi:uncharacterized protein A4U43_C09F4010 [Asparagus officinalis]|uniref:FAD-binding domain-containing protein n=1 Tax=Asparagus officinalis TaxID=4686 RepID=A0A5P1E5P2_ASPOF|nr:uncharacterized protein LOC109824317 [Asparagus officinalis]ONK57779.1 uncharacterized protein A4U43_C09F4010 [Asparagus officinalis]
MRKQEEYEDIVIVGAGISGLATALALQRKGIRSIVLERSETLRATGAGISIYLNGWHALDHLGVGNQLRAKSTPINEIHGEWVYNDDTEVIPISKEGLRCVKRSDLIEALANSLPAESIRFGCQIVAIETDPVTSFPIVHTADGCIMRTKILIGCDGSNSIVASSLGLKPANLFQTREVRGYTSYPNGHGLSNHFLHLKGDKLFVGRIPVDENLVFWFVDQEFHPKDLETRRDPILIRDRTLEAVKDCPKEVIEMVKHCDLSSLSLTRIRYRAPWHLALKNLCKGTMTVAGDAMHQMDPSIGQGGCTALEDAVVLARSLSREMSVIQSERKISDQEIQNRAEVALRRYTSERKWRILILSTKSFLIGSLFGASWLKRFTFLTLFSTFFGGRFGHTQYNCGHL